MLKFELLFEREAWNKELPYEYMNILLSLLSVSICNTFRFNHFTSFYK